MGTEPEPPRPAGSLAALFQPTPLPRWRAVFSITCAAAALLAAGGMIEYGAGSPETQGTAVATYWALLFGLHVVAFGGAGLLAAFPALARLPIKLVWLALVATVYWLAFAVWHAHQPAATVGDWVARSSAYAPAALVVFIGLFLSAQVRSEDVP
jgi:hypothetical protein